MRSDHLEALLQDVAHVVGKCKIWSLEEWLVGGSSLQPGMKVHRRAEGPPVPCRVAKPTRMMMRNSFPDICSR